METSRWHRLWATLLRRRISLLLVFVLMILSAPFIYRSSRLIGLPDIGEPFDVEKFGTIEITDEENAFVEYDQAYPTDDPVGVDDVIDQGWSAATPSIRDWLEENREALEQLKRGSKKPKALFGQPKDQSYRTMIAVQKQLSLSRLARLEAARLRDAGDVAGAWELYRAAFRHSRHVGMYGGSMNRLVGNALHELVAERIIDCAVDPRIDSRLLRMKLDSVISDYEMTQPPSTTFRSAYFDTMNDIDETQMTAYVKELDVPDPLMRCLLFLQNEPEVGKRVVKLAYANWLSQVDLPRHQQSRLCPGELYLFRPVNGAPLAGEISPAEIERFFSESRVAEYAVGYGPPLGASTIRERSRQAQLVVALAAQLYYRDHERFPNTSAEFLDGYLSDWPLDPHSDEGSPMHYRFDAATGDAIVWSVGPNGIDDGGNIDAHWAAEDFDHGVTIRAPAK